MRDDPEIAAASTVAELLAIRARRDPAAPALLAPFRSPGGEVVFALAIGWMALGYGILQRMSQPPRESRLRLREATL